MSTLLETVIAIGASTAERTPVWDIGGGSTFTPTKTTRIYTNMWLTSNMDVSGISAEPKLYRT